MTQHRHIKSFIHANRQLMVVILTILVAAFLPFSTLAYDFQGCNDCHKATLDGDNSRRYLHSPFKEGQCGECHAAPAVKDNLVGQFDRQKIDWLVESAVMATSHRFVLLSDKLGDTLVVELRGGSTAGAFSRHEIAIPSCDILSEVEDYGRPPTISGVQVLKVQRGLFLTATIGWQTDTLANATVRYANQGISITSESSTRLARQHQVVLYNLQPDEQYRFTAISRDLFGRSQVSKPKTFSTSKTLAPPQPNNSANPAGDGNKVGIASRFQRVGNNYLVELTLNQPASICIGSRNLALSLPDDEFRAGPNCGVVSSTSACLNCHNAHLDIQNISPTKAEIIIPPEYPTLPSGQITCSSCHAPHGSDYRYHTRKPSEHELCAGCHLWGT